MSERERKWITNEDRSCTSGPGAAALIGRDFGLSHSLFKNNIAPKNIKVSH